MHICHLIDDLSVGGAQNVVKDIVNGGPDEVEHSVCYMGQYDELKTEFNQATLRSFDGNFKFDPKAIYHLARTISNEKYDIIHFHLPYSQSVGRAVCKLFSDSPTIGTFHNVRENYHPVLRLSESFTRRWENKHVAVSEGVQNSYTGEKNWQVIHNGINIVEFNKKITGSSGEFFRNEYGIPQETRLLLNVGRYRPVKRQTDIIEAFHLTKGLENTHLAIVGWGPEQKALESAVKRYNLKDSVHITGKVEEIFPAYAAADIFVSASVREGLPLNHLEAMAAELPILSTNIPGVREVVSDECGILIPPRSPQTLAKKMEWLADSEDAIKMGKRGFQRAKRSFNIEQMVHAYYQLYYQLSGSD